MTLCSPDTSSFYSLSISRPDGSQLSMAAFAGRKVMVLTFDASNPDRAMLLMADSLQKADSSAIVVGVPAADFTGYASDSTLTLLHDSLGVSYPFTHAVLVTRTNGANQQGLFKWLTDVTLNQHFDRDVEAPGQLFLVSEQGVLYGIFTKDTSSTDILNALNQSISQ